MKEFFKEFWNNQRDSMKWAIIALVVAIIGVVIVCGIYGNNEDNFWRKGDDIAEVTSGKPRPPFYPKETPPIKKGVNIVNGKIVIKA